MQISSFLSCLVCILVCIFSLQNCFLRVPICAKTVKIESSASIVNILIPKEKPCNHCGYTVFLFGRSVGIRTRPENAKSLVFSMHFIFSLHFSLRFLLLHLLWAFGYRSRKWLFCTGSDRCGQCVYRSYGRLPNLPSRQYP